LRALERARSPRTQANFGPLASLSTFAGLACGGACVSALTLRAAVSPVCNAGAGPHHSSDRQHGTARQERIIGGRQMRVTKRPGHHAPWALVARIGNLPLATRRRPGRLVTRLSRLPLPRLWFCSRACGAASGRGARLLCGERLALLRQRLSEYWEGRWPCACGRGAGRVR